MRNKKFAIGDIEVKQNAFLKSKNPIEINEVDIDKIVISDKASYGNKIKSLCIMLPKMSGYVKRFHEATIPGKTFGTKLRNPVTLDLTQKL